MSTTSCQPKRRRSYPIMTPTPHCATSSKPAALELIQPTRRPTPPTIADWQSQVRSAILRSSNAPTDRHPFASHPMSARQACIIEDHLLPSVRQGSGRAPGQSDHPRASASHGSMPRPHSTHGTASKNNLKATSKTASLLLPPRQQSTRSVLATTQY